MKVSLVKKIFELAVLNKAVTFKKGALVILSTPLSLGIFEFLKIILMKVELFNLVLPLVAICVCLLMYLLFWFTDFIWGLIASKHESKNNPDWVESHKLYNSLGKLGGVLLVDMLLLMLVLFITIVGYEKTALAGLFIAVLLNVIMMFYEFHSIGENIKRKTGSKPKYFEFIDRITKTLEEKIIRKIELI